MWNMLLFISVFARGVGVMGWEGGDVRDEQKLAI